MRRRLLPNWFAARDPDLNVYYHNTATEETTWVAPLAAVKGVAQIAAQAQLHAQAPMSLQPADRDT